MTDKHLELLRKKQRALKKRLKRTLFPLNRIFLQIELYNIGITINGTNTNDDFLNFIKILKAKVKAIDNRLVWPMADLRRCDLLIEREHVLTEIEAKEEFAKAHLKHIERKP